MRKQKIAVSVAVVMWGVTSGASALSYATVYPLVMFLRIISPQLLAIILWAGA